MNDDPMTASIPPQSELFSICDRWSEDLVKLEDGNDRIEYITNALPPLLRNRQLWLNILEGMVAGSSFPDLRRATMFEDELVLYPNSRRLFSVRLFLYESNVYTPIHDHNAWGVMGAIAGRLDIIRYHRDDDGSRDGFARLSPAGRELLEPGQIDVTRPLDAGIHQTGNPGQRVSMMLSVYGNPIRRLYINRFDPDAQRVFKMYPPRMHKKNLAGQALKAFIRSA